MAKWKGNGLLNRRVLGSNPARGIKKGKHTKWAKKNKYRKQLKMNAEEEYKKDVKKVEKAL